MWGLYIGVYGFECGGWGWKRGLLVIGNNEILVIFLCKFLMLQDAGIYGIGCEALCVVGWMGVLASEVCIYLARLGEGVEGDLEDLLNMIDGCNGIVVGGGVEV